MTLFERPCTTYEIALEFFARTADLFIILFCSSPLTATPENKYLPVSPSILRNVLLLFVEEVGVVLIKR